MKITKTFVLFVFFFSLGIFLHEISHHIFGVKSELSLSQNYPLEAVTENNKVKGIIGALSGPLINLVFTYIGLSLYHKWRALGYYISISNAFLVFSGALINLIVDIMNEQLGNDLQVASKLLNINIYILPVVFSLFAFFPFFYLIKKQSKKIYVILFIAWLTSGLILKTFDTVFSLRFSIM